MSLNMERGREAQGQLSRATAVGSGAVGPSRDVATGIRGILGTNRQRVPLGPGAVLLPASQNLLDLHLLTLP